MTMNNNFNNSQKDKLSRILNSHLILSKRKSVSYLPKNTIENHIGITLEDYTKMILGNKNKYIIFSDKETYIYSGAIFAYNEEFLGELLENNYNIIVENRWTTNPEEFVKRIAFEWIEDDNPIKKIIKLSFGDF